MENELTEQQINEICRDLRLVDLLKENESKINEIPEFKKLVKQLLVNVNKIMNLLTEEQRDYVLEIHKQQLDYIKKKEAKRIAQKARREVKKNKNPSSDQ